MLQVFNTESTRRALNKNQLIHLKSVTPSNGLGRPNEIVFATTQIFNKKRFFQWKNPEFRWRFEFMKKSLIVFGVGQQSDIISFYLKKWEEK